jgi:hypothetical protein
VISYRSHVDHIVMCVADGNGYIRCDCTQEVVRAWDSGVVSES